MPKGVYPRRNRNPPRRRQPSLKPDYHMKVVLATGLIGPKLRIRAMAAREAARQQARQKGGLRTIAQGNGHLWTPETARKAAQKLWRTKQRKVKGVRVGVRAARAPRVDRAPLRAYYSQQPTSGVTYISDGENPGWQVTDPNGTVRRISERAALQKLGHLRTYKQFMPRTITPVYNRNSGMPSAGTGADVTSRNQGEAHEQQASGYSGNPSAAGVCDNLRASRDDERAGGECAPGHSGTPESGLPHHSQS